jgi:hypothetical protein
MELVTMQMRKKLAFTIKDSSDYRYRESVAKAVKWLGDRYLLARPIKSPRPIRIPCSTG